MKVLSHPVRSLAVLLALLPLAPRVEAKIGALGRIIPAGDILNLPGTGDVVAEIHVKEGEVVQAGGALVTFSGHQDAQQQVAVAELDLRDAEEVGKMALATAEVKLEIVKRDYDFAHVRLERFEQLGGEAMSPQQLEARAYQTKAAQLAYQAASKDLERLKLDRQLKLERATAQLAIARSKLERTTLRAPRKLTVLKINSVVGVPAGGAAISLADLDEMQVVTEVFAGDLPRLKVNQVATVTGSTFPGTVTGRVLTISRVISGRSKVAEVLIRLDDPKAASQLLNLEVNVSIDD